MNWSDTPPEWSTPIGEKIDRFFQAVAARFPGYSDTIVVFGSATIHLRLDPSFNSADADLRVSTHDILAFKALTEEIGMGKSGKDSGICPHAPLSREAPGATGRRAADYQYCAMLRFRKATLRASCSMPSTPSSMLIQPSKPTRFSSLKMAS